MSFLHGLARGIIHGNLFGILVVLFFALIMATCAQAHEFTLCKLPASVARPCNPPALTVIVTYTQTRFPLNVPVRFGGTSTNPAGYWLWIKAGNAPRACTQAEQSQGPLGRNAGCFANVGDVLYQTMPVTVTP